MNDTVSDAPAQLLLHAESDVSVNIDDMNFDDLDITNEDVNFDEIDSLMSKFQEDERVRDALEQGIDMREYSRQIERDLREAEKLSTADYITEAPNLAELYHQIQSCDAILIKMENLLSGFQSDLGNISDEIRYLQDQSSDMSVKLRNRKKAVTEKLGGLISEVAISRQLAHRICEGEVNETYGDYLVELHKKMAYVRQPENANIKACATVAPELEKLRVKAVTKIREFLLQQIQALRKPNTNIQIIQQNKLVKYRYLNRFLYKYAKEYAIEVRTAYQDTLSRIYFSYCKDYVNGLMKLHCEIGSKNDLLGVEEGTLKSFFTSKFSKTRTNVFSLGDPSRADILTQDDGVPYIVLHEAQENKSSYSYEILFRSMNAYLRDAVTSEYLFDQNFFGKINMFSTIFGKCANLYVDNIIAVTSNSFDAIGLLIVIRIAAQSYDTLKEKNIECLYTFYEKVLGVLWHRFMEVCTLHSESVKMADPQRLGAVDIRPHYVTRRVAEFVASLHSLNEGFDDGRVQEVIHSITAHLDVLLKKMAQFHPTKQDKLVFIINNYDQILTVCESRAVSSHRIAPIKQIMDSRVAMFVEVELDKYYKRLIAFVKEYGPIVIESAAPENEKIDKGLVDSLVKEFAASWKDVIDSINKDVLLYFSNFLTGSHILQQVLTQLVVYYTRFEEVIRKCFRGTSFKDFVPTARVTYHIKKSSVCF